MVGRAAFRYLVPRVLAFPGLVVVRTSLVLLLQVKSDG